MSKSLFKCPAPRIAAHEQHNVHISLPNESTIASYFYNLLTCFCSLYLVERSKILSILPSSTHAGLAEQANTLKTYLVLSSRRLNRCWRAHGPCNANSSQYHRWRPDKHGAACLSVVHGLSILCSGNTCMHATLQGERYPSSLTSLPCCMCVCTAWRP